MDSVEKKMVYSKQKHSSTSTFPLHDSGFEYRVL
jgi:hypothetical protein